MPVNSIKKWLKKRAKRPDNVAPVPAYLRKNKESQRQVNEALKIIRGR